MATSQPKRKRRSPRSLQRLVHLIAALPILAYVYVTPPADSLATIAVRFVVLPLVVASGMVMWQWPRIRKALRSRSTT